MVARGGGGGRGREERRQETLSDKRLVLVLSKEGGRKMEKHILSNKRVYTKKTELAA